MKKTIGGDTRIIGRYIVFSILAVTCHRVGINPRLGGCTVVERFVASP